MEIIVFTKSEDIAYSPCAIPLVLGGCIKSFDDIIMHEESYYLEKNIEIHLSTTVTGVDATKRQYLIEKDSDTGTIRYDKLVLATGSELVTPEFDIDDLNNVHSLANISDGRIIQSPLRTRKILYLSQICRLVLKVLMN